MAGQSKSVWHLTRLLMVLCWALWILAFFGTVTLFQAVLQIHVVAQVVHQNTLFLSDLAQMTPLAVTNRLKIDEMLVRYYLEMRYSVIRDKMEMARRWAAGGIIDYLSSPAAYKAFAPSQAEVESKISNTPSRVIDITRLERHDDYYSVDFDLYELGNNRWNKRSRTVVLQFAYARVRAALSPAIGNPNGFIITRVSESEKKSTTN